MSERRIMSEGIELPAFELHGGHIGRVVRFNWQFAGSNVTAVVTGELRQVYHVSDQVHLSLTGFPLEGTDITEFELSPAEAVVLMDVK